MKKRFLIGASILLMVGLTACESAPASVPAESSSLLPMQAYGDSTGMSKRREALYAFIENRLTGPSGIHTNLKDTPQTAEAASGHEVLSESAGILMRYYAITGQRQKFDEEWARAKRIFDLPSGFSYRYSPLLTKSYPINAAVDDLRMIRSLHEAAQAFRDPAYANEAKTYGQRFYEHNVKDGFLYDFYDDTYRMTNDFITLCYIDLKTLELLPLSGKSKGAFTARMLGISKGGYISDDFPFYETRYDYKKAGYSSENINTVESLLTILALTEVRQHEPSSIRFVKEQVKAGTLYGQYAKNGKPTTDIRSTAIYAIAAMIGAELGDKALYEDSVRRMNEFQILDPGSELNGGFGDTATGQAYSFDNLMALLAYVY
ncbi:hypothetical protein [Paenibacillus puerhi]|uniref:hypothetical protein n=1 Tax=Paenibacillus puerhi TaxID=2692622 RepID=UPI00135A4E08|nr:hypothetical protein [Paenibacillus puerhi]